MKLSKPSSNNPLVSSTERAIMNILSGSNWLLNELNAAAVTHDITLSQYNVLRVLREHHPKRLRCGDISRQLIERTPDLTRLLDRLETQGLIERSRARHDRRVVEVGLTEAGLKRLDQTEETMTQTGRRLMRNLTIDERRQLSHYLERLRDDP